MHKTFYTHKQVIALQAVTALLAVLVMIATGLAQTEKILTYLPILASAQVAPASTCNGLAPIQDTDTGDLDATVLSDGSVIVAYQNRQDNSRVHVARHEGTRLVELATPPQPSSAQPAPQFTPTGAKQGSVAVVSIAPGKNRLYYTQRVADETPNEGPYSIWCMVF